MPNGSPTWPHPPTTTIFRISLIMTPPVHYFLIYAQGNLGTLGDPGLNSNEPNSRQLSIRLHQLAIPCMLYQQELVFPSHFCEGFAVSATAENTLGRTLLRC